MARQTVKERHCANCLTVFASRQSLHKHVSNKVCRRGARGGGGRRAPAAKLPCPKCEQKFSRKDNLARHLKLVHSGSDARVYLCGICPEYFKSRHTVTMHRMLVHSGSGRGGRGQFREVSTAHKRACQVFRLEVPGEIRDAHAAYEFAVPQVRRMINRLLAEQRNIRVSLGMTVRFVKSNTGQENNPDAIGVEGVDVLTIPMQSSYYSMRYMAGTEMEQAAQMFDQINHTLDAFNHNGSGWIVSDVLSFDLQALECHSLSGACALHTVKAPRGKRGLDLDNLQADRDLPLDGERCFFRAVAAALLESQEGIVPSLREIEEFIHANMIENVPTPVQIKDIDSFEDANKHLDLCVNVMYQDDSRNGDVYPSRPSKKLSANNQVNLLLFFTEKAERTEESSDTVMHYAWIPDIASLLGKKMVTENGNRYKHSKLICYNCFLQFNETDTLNKHAEWCHSQSGQKVVLPARGEKVRYEQKHRETLMPWCFAFDFETLQVQPEAGPCSCKEEEMHKCKHKTKVITEQPPFAYSIVMMSREGEICEDMVYVGHDAADHFLETIVGLEEKYKQYLRDNYKPLVLTLEVQEKFFAAEVCYMCGNEFNHDACMDHDHLTGEYLGAAHNRCNLMRSEIKGKLCGFAHNFSGYDSHCIMKAIADRKAREADPTWEGKKLRLEAIPLNTEKFKMLRLGQVMLLDSMSFLGDSLDRLVENLKVSNHDFPLTRQWLADDNKRELIMRKGVYPYEYMTGMHVLDETCLPPPEAFASKLAATGAASPADYEHAQKVWKEFDCQNLSDFTKVYVRSDCYQLLEAITELRMTLYDEFHLDLCHFLSLPMMAKECLFKHTKMEVELLTDIEMIHMIRSNIRGGLSYVNQRHFDTEKESAKRKEPVVIAYLDANNLYGYAMSKPMPVGNFCWLSRDEIDKIDLAKDISPENETGYIFECTLEYPLEYHTDHNTLPLAAHRQTIDGSMLSEYALKALEVQKKKGITYKATKLTSSYLRREKYVCHGENLLLYLELGMRLVEIHRVISFRQEAFIKPYIDFCSKKRAESKTKSRSNTFKLAANAVFGKMIENSNNRMDTKFVTNRSAALKRNTDPRVRGQMVLGEHLTVAFMAKKEQKLNQLWPVGFTILELSKAHMLKLFYRTIKPAFYGRASVLLSDTDSFVLALPSPSVDQALLRLKHVMDFSNYPEDHPLYNPAFKNVPGLLKNESPANDIVECVGVRSKVYALRTAKDFDSRCKGVKKIVRKAIPFDDFKKTVLETTPRVVQVKQFCIQSKHHVNRLLQMSKVAMTSFDDKRSLATCGIHSFPYGSKLIEMSEESGECFYCSNPHLFA